MKKITPYIYIAFFTFISAAVFSQNTHLLNVIGNDTVETRILNQLDDFSKKIPDSLLNTRLESMRNKLYLLGYINYQLDSISKKDSVFTAKFKLHSPVKNIIITHPNSHTFSKQYHLKELPKNKVLIPISQIQTFLSNLVAYYQNKGFPFVQVKLIHLVNKEGVLYAGLAINTTDQRTIDKIVIKGYTTFPNSFLTHRAGIHIGELFNKKKIQKLSRNIQDLDFVDEIKKPEVLFTKDSTSLYLYLKKVKSNHFDGLIGIASRDNKKLFLNGFLNLKLLNTLNYGENFEFNWLSDGKQSQNLAIDFSIPYVFKSSFSGNYRFAIYKKDSSFITNSQVLSIDYDIKRNQKIGIIFSRNNSHRIQSYQEPVDFSANFYGFYYRYKKTYNHPVFKNKFYFYNAVQQGKRNTETQYNITNKVSILFPVKANKNITVSSVTKILFSKNYLYNELFRIGGSTSIRGFDNQSIFTSKYSYLNMDYHYLINTDSYLSILSDFGIFENKNNTKPLSSLYVFGIGYTTKTAIGSISIQYAIGNDSQNPFSLNNSKLHVRLSQHF